MINVLRNLLEFVICSKDIEWYWLPNINLRFDYAIATKVLLTLDIEWYSLRYFREIVVLKSILSWVVLTIKDNSIYWFRGISLSFRNLHFFGKQIMLVSVKCLIKATYIIAISKDNSIYTTCNKLKNRQKWKESDV